MPKKSGVEKIPNKSLELDKKLNAIKGEVNAIIDEEEKEIHQDLLPEPEPVKQPKKQPTKIIEEIVEEEDPEPVIIRKIIKKKPKQIIEEVVEEEEEDCPAGRPKDLQKKKKDGRGRPRKVQEPEQNDEELLQKKYMSQKQKQQQQQMPQGSRHRQEDQTYRPQYRDRFDTILDETNIDLLRQEMKKEMKRRLMSSLFD